VVTKLKQRGFSMVEALAALVLLLVALLPLSTLPAATNRLYVVSAAREQAALLAVQKLDELESKKFNDLSGGSQTIGGYKMVWTVGEAVDQRKEEQVRSNEAGERRCVPYLGLNAVELLR